MHVTEDGLADFVAALRHMRNFAGAVVTMPHKTRAAQLVDTLTDEARLVGAVNVIRREGNATLSGTMLDGEGFVSGLAAAGHAVSGTRCILYGAGGAASAVAVALARHGCSRLTLQNRTLAKAESLAVRLREAFPSVRVDTDAESAIPMLTGQLELMLEFMGVPR